MELLFILIVGSGVVICGIPIMLGDAWRERGKSHPRDFINKP